MSGIGKIFEKKYGGLVFSLLSGCAYYIILLGFILRYTHTGGMLLGFFLFPAVVCGMALVIFKAVRRLQDEENFGKINMLLWLHVVLMLLSLVFVFDIIAL